MYFINTDNLKYTSAAVCRKIPSDKEHEQTFLHKNRFYFTFKWPPNRFYTQTLLTVSLSLFQSRSRKHN